jgi:hypothetical protein
MRRHDSGAHVRAEALPDYALIEVNGGSDAVDVIRSQRWNMVVLQQGRPRCH